MFDHLGNFVSRRWVLVLLFWVVLVAGIRWVAPRWDDVTHDGDFAYLPQEMTSARGEQLLDAAFPEVLAKSQVVLVVARRDGPLTEPDLAVADHLVEQFTPAEDDTGPIVSVLSHQTEVVGQKLKSADGRAVLILLQLRNEFMAVDNMDLLPEIYEELDAVRRQPDFPQGLQLGVTGSAAIGTDMLFSAAESIRNTEWTTIFLVIVILLLVYRAPGLVIVPLVTIGASVLVAMSLVALATQVSDQLGLFDFKIFKTTKIFVVVILFGAGTDYCLFLISRYKEELQRGLNPTAAVSQALSSVGDALAASALTTIVGIGAMVFCDFGKFRNSGPAIALCLFVALVACVTLAPALLRATGRRVFWPFGLGRRRPSPGAGTDDDTRRLQIADFDAGSSIFSRFWQRLARQIIARPGTILVVSLLLLSPLVFQGLHVEVTYDLLSELRADRPSVWGTELLRRYFPAGETGPVTVLAYNPSGQFDTDKAQWEKIQPLTEELLKLSRPDGGRSETGPVTSVRSLIEPLGERSKSGLFGTIKDTIIRRHERTRQTYLAQAPDYVGKVTRFDLVFEYDPFSVESIRMLDHVEKYLYKLAQDPDSKWYGTDFYFVGTTAGIRDLRAVTASDLTLIKCLVPIAVLAVLIIILRRPWVCIYLILSVLLGYFVTIGVAELFFSWWYGDTFHGLDWKVPVFLFVILIAVGQDYNIYLTTRVFEEQSRRGLEEGLRVAVIRTGGIITSCGVIMAGTFASMITGTLRAIQELGFALSLGVLLDTLVIRPVLVPAFLVLWDRFRSESQAADAPESTGAEPQSEPSREAPNADSAPSVSSDSPPTATARRK